MRHHSTLRSLMIATASAILLLPGAAAQATLYPTPRGTFDVHGAIEQEWLRLGGAQGQLGNPLTSEASTPAEAGAFNSFERGSVYWSPSTGAHEVHGSFWQYWAARGWENSWLGFPATNEFSAGRGVGQHFQGGSLYWSPSTSAHAVHGAFYGFWAARGWERSYLGFPLTDEFQGAGTGVGQDFQGAALYWTSSTGAHEVRGAIYQSWAAMGWERSSLGYPTSDEYDYAGGRRSDFQGGSITWTPRGGAVVEADITVSGTGTDVVRVAKPAGPMIAEVTSGASGGNFIVWSLDRSSSRIDLLANEIGSWNGVVPVDFRGFASSEQTVAFQVTATGPWTIRLLPMSRVARFGEGQTIGESRSTVWRYTGGSGIAHLTNSASGGNFIVTSYDSTTRYDGLLANEIGRFDGRVPVHGDTYLVVKSGGPWTVTVD